MKDPKHALKNWREISRSVHNASRVALLTDFDGTLAHIVGNPDAARLPARAQRCLAGIAATGALVGVVSGRKLEDVRRRVGVKGIWYAGAHGLVLQDPGNRRFTLASQRECRQIQITARLLARRLRGLPGLRVESKGASVALHYRAASPTDTKIAQRELAQALAGRPELSLLPGKKVWEVLPNSRTDKWSAARFILRREKWPGRGLVLYLGDDETDERVFRRMRGISVVVGRKHGTAAHFYLRSPAETTLFLARLKEELG
jgi:trehalose-phosphatase